MRYMPLGSASWWEILVPDLDAATAFYEAVRMGVDSVRW